MVLFKLHVEIKALSTVIAMISCIFSVAVHMHT